MVHILMQKHKPDDKNKWCNGREVREGYWEHFEPQPIPIVDYFLFLD